jgi:hypothetical protein
LQAHKAAAHRQIAKHFRELAAPPWNVGMNLSVHPVLVI